MVESATTRRPGESKRTNGRSADALPSYAVERLLTEQLGKTPRRDRLDRDERAYRALLRRSYREGPKFRATITQIAAGMGYAVSGDRTEDLNSYGNNVRRAMNSLQELGLIHWGGIKRPNGQWWCLRIELLDLDARAQRARRHKPAEDGPPGADPGRLRRAYRAQRPRRRRGCPPSPFFGHKVSTPFAPPPPTGAGGAQEGPTDPRVPSHACACDDGAGFAGESPAERPRPGPRPGAEPEAIAAASPGNGRTEGGGSAGLTWLLDPPPLGDADGWVAAMHESLAAGRAPGEWLFLAFERMFAAWGRRHQFSIRRYGDELERSIAHLDRYGGRGAGLELATALLSDLALDCALGEREAPHSLAWLVPVLAEAARQARRGFGRTAVQRAEKRGAGAGTIERRRRNRERAARFRAARKTNRREL